LHGYAPTWGLKRRALTGFVVLLSLATSSSVAAGSVTIGQVSSPTTLGSCGPDSDWVQATVVAGNSYVVPGTGTITSWKMFGGTNTGDEITMKIWRPVPGQVDAFQVVGHAGPHPITPGGTAGNTFSASVPVQPGDILGFHTGSTFTKCAFDAPGEKYQALPMSDVQDGQTGQFFPAGTTNFRLDISAVFVPSNDFTLGAVARNKKKGTATIPVSVPNEGGLAASGKGVTASLLGPPNQRLLIRARGKKKKTLNETGKVKLTISVTFTPAGGDPSTQPVKVILKKKL
jgi:hypothetical protein